MVGGPQGDAGARAKVPVGGAGFPNWLGSHQVLPAANRFEEANVGALDRVGGPGQAVPAKVKMEVGNGRCVHFV